MVVEGCRHHLHCLQRTLRTEKLLDNSSDLRHKLDAARVRDPCSLPCTSYPGTQGRLIGSTDVLTWRPCRNSGMVPVSLQIHFNGDNRTFSPWDNRRDTPHTSRRSCIVYFVCDVRQKGNLQGKGREQTAGRRTAGAITSNGPAIGKQ